MMTAAVTAAVANGNHHHHNSRNCQNGQDMVNITIVSKGGSKESSMKGCGG
jgi:hypothetical protein